MTDDTTGETSASRATPVAMTIAGSDPSAGAGIQADLKTFSALGVYGSTVITALTAQNTRGVSGVFPVSAEFVTDQLDTLFADLDIRVVKTGMLGGPDVVAAVVAALDRHAVDAVVVDPVMVAASGDRLVPDETVVAVREHLLPLATVVTPNLPETAALIGRDIDWSDQAAEQLADAGAEVRKLGAGAAVIKGGHAGGDESNDVLVGEGYVDVLRAPRVATSNTHGTGCTFASAIAAYLTRGFELRDAVAAAKTYLTNALHAADELHVGSGHGPVQHFHNTATQQKESGK